MIADIHYAFRALLKNASFAIPATLCLGVSIGMSATIFSLVDGLVMRPFRYDTDRLVSITASFRSREASTLSGPEYHAIATGVPSLESAAAYDLGNWSLTAVTTPERLVVAFVTANLFDTYGVKPTLGRTFLPDETRGDQGVRTVIVSSRFWKRSTAANQRVPGAVIHLNGEPFSVVGVLPPEFLLGATGLGGADLYVPFRGSIEKLPRGFRELPIVGRMRAGTSIDRVRAELAVLSRRLEEQEGSSEPEYKGWNLRAVPLADTADPKLRQALMLLLGAVLGILLISCVNVANLILARRAGRLRETAIRAALGASRWRLLRQYLAEGIVLSAVGAIAGVFVAVWALDLLLSLLPSHVEVLPPGAKITVNLRVLGFSAALAAATAILFGITPALGRAVTAIQLHTARSRAGDFRLANGLVAAEVALSLVLVAGTALMLRSYYNVLHVDPGFQPENTLVMRTTLPRNKYSGAAITRFFQELEQRAASIPGVASAGIASQVPPLTGIATRYRREGSADASAELIADQTLATRDYFRTLGIPLLQGRIFDPTDDRPASPGVAIVNQTFARRMFGAADPIGKRISAGPDVLTVIGVVASSRNRGLELPHQPEVFTPVGRDPGKWNQLWLIVRTRQEPALALNAIRSQIRSMDPDQPIYLAMTLKEALAFRLLQRRAATWLLTVFGVTALLLAAIGLYGVVTHSVTRRTQEIGVRMALGATRANVLRMVVRQGMRMALAGVVIGAAAALASARLLDGMLFGLEPLDPVAFAATAAVLMAVTSMASYLPALRATRVDPMVALRYE